MKYAVFVSAGLGDAVLLVPFINKLKETGTVLGFFNSAYGCQELFRHTDLFDEAIILNTNTDYFKSWLDSKNLFDVTYLNNFSASRKNLLLAATISKKIITNNLPPNLSSIGRSKTVFVEPKPGIHDALQNLYLLGDKSTYPSLKESDFRIPYKEIAALNDTIPSMSSPYIAVQISSANNTQEYKNWPVESWTILINNLSDQYTKVNFVLVGDANETELADHIMKEGIDRVHNAVGRTSVVELVTIIRESSLFIGLDGGPMHIAVSQGTPTFTIWGASDYNLYGYHQIDPQKHKIVYHEMPCHPCNAWINANTTRVSDPKRCPDFACIRSLTPEHVLSELTPFVNQILNFS